MKKNLLVVVLGMHRSGTSAITRGLQVLGVGLGDKLMQPAIGINDKGFWEDTDLYELNVEMLDALNINWAHVASIESADVEVLHQKGYLLRAAELLRRKFSGTTIFGFKDPRVAKLLPFWKDVFKDCQLDVRYVLALRHPLSVVRSLSKRDGIEAERSYLLWLDYVFNSLSGSASDKRVLVDYDLLMQSPDHELNRMAQQLSLEVNLIELQNYKTDFLKQGMRHSICSLNDLLLDAACPAIVKEMYASLLDVASDKENIDGVVIQDKLASWAVELNRLKPILRLVDRLPTPKTELTNTDLRDLSGDRAAYEKAAHMFAAEARNEAIALLEELAEKGSSWWEVYNDLAVQYFEAGDYVRAVPYFKKGIALEGNAGITARNYATVLVMAGALNEALAVLGAILHGHPHDAAILKLICDISEAKGKEQLTDHGNSELEDNNFGEVSAEESPFDESEYLTENPDVAAAVRAGKFLSGHEHYENVGKREGRLFKNYGEWVRRYDTLTDADREIIATRIAAFRQTPLISVVMPVFNPPLNMLEEAISSVQGQLYPNWELCIADDASTDVAVHELLQNFVSNDARIKVIYREKNGHISAASNSALDLVKGEYVALLDNDDILSEHALFWVAHAINANPEAGLIYSDEDKIDQSGQRYGPYFKPDWNPDLFLSQNFISHLGVYRTDLVEKIGGFRAGYEGSQDYDLALRCTEQLEPRQIVHIPRVLYHWRCHPGSAALAISEKSYAPLAGQRALNDHFARLHISAKAELTPFYMYRARYTIPTPPPPLVSLIVVAYTDLNSIKRCIESIVSRTTYKNYEILIVYNGSDNSEILVSSLNPSKDNRVRILRDERPFNFAALNNAAVQQAKGTYVALINNSIEVIAPEWLEEMLGLAIQPGVGAVGGRLWYPDETLQFCGYITGLAGVAGHSHGKLPRGGVGYFGRANLVQTLSAVSASCLLVEKNKFQEIGGLDEVNLKTAFNDVDFCLRLREAGYRNIWTPYAHLYHHEYSTSGYDVTVGGQSHFKEETDFMHKRWGDLLTNDPAYNPNLTLDNEDYSYAFPPRIEPLTIATQPNEIKIFQIFYDEATKLKVDPNFIPLDNSENLRADWFEYWPIRHVLLNHSFNEDAYLGFFSPKFFEKTGMDGKAVLEKVRYSNAEIISFSPYFDIGVMNANPFIQAEKSHPGIIETTQSLLPLLGMDLTLNTLICDQTTTIFSNFFVARYSFWKKWFAYAEKIFAVCEGEDSELKAKLVQATSYRKGGEYAMKVFVLERLVTLVMESLGIGCTVGVDLSKDKAPLYWPDSRENLAGLIMADALKGQYRKTGLSVYKDEFFKVTGGIKR